MLKDILYKTERSSIVRLSRLLLIGCWEARSKIAWAFVKANYRTIELLFIRKGL